MFNRLTILDETTYKKDYIMEKYEYNWDKLFDTWVSKFEMESSGPWEKFYLLDTKTPNKIWYMCTAGGNSFHLDVDNNLIWLEGLSRNQEDSLMKYILERHRNKSETFSTVDQKLKELGIIDV